MMDQVLGFLNQNIVVTMLSILLGGYLLNRIAESRARTQAAQTRILEFLETIGTDLNKAMTSLFREVRLGDLEDPESSKFMDDIASLFGKRFIVKIMSQTHMKNTTFSDKYVSLCRELREIGAMLLAIREGSTSDGPDAVAVKHTEELDQTWPVVGDKNEYKDVDRKYRKTAMWLDAVWIRAEELVQSQMMTTVK